MSVALEGIRASWILGLTRRAEGSLLCFRMRRRGSRFRGLESTPFILFNSISLRFGAFYLPSIRLFRFYRLGG